MKSIKAIIFDLDGVITDTAHYHYLGWKQLSDELNIIFNEEMNESLKGIDRMNSLELILKNSEKQFTNEEKMQLANRKNEYYKELIKTMTPKDLLPGAVEILEKLRSLKIKIGLASASKNAILVLNNLKITHLFDYIVDASTIKNGKPNPEIFLKVAKNLNVNPEDCIGVEDAEAGVEAIKSSGMYCVGIGNPKTLYKSDCVISNLLEFEVEKYI